ncbi:homocysteine S-methyltransferase family protein [Rhodoligotrophos appendicifer]|nr:homocysteine S-methyltransferase family protein [Rhodoligotrophos appendicifer]
MFGSCCGTDPRHIQAIAAAVLSLPQCPVALSGNIAVV